MGILGDIFAFIKAPKEYKKIRLEIEKLEAEKRESIIKPATREEVEKYDLKTGALVDRVESPAPRERFSTRLSPQPFLLLFVRLFLMVGAIAIAVYLFLRFIVD